MALIKSAGYMAPLSEGEILVTPPGFMTMQLAIVDSWGLRWGVDFPHRDAASAKQLTDLLLAFPSLSQQGYDDMRKYLIKLGAPSSSSGASANGSASAKGSATPAGTPRNS